jgi:hypothetical protein
MYRLPPSAECVGGLSVLTLIVNGIATFPSHLAEQLAGVGLLYATIVSIRDYFTEGNR